MSLLISHSILNARWHNPIVSMYDRLKVLMQRARLLAFMATIETIKGP